MPLKALEIIPRTLSGTLKVIPSKSITHRALICAALSRGTSNIDGILFSDDVQATAGALQELGIADISIKDGAAKISGFQAGKTTAKKIDCGESGSTLRFLLPVSLIFGGASFTGRGRLMQRPLVPYRELFEKRGISWEEKDGILSVSGSLSPGLYDLAGNVSSQFISGLLFALPLLSSDSRIVLTTDIESLNYIELTREMQEKFGVTSFWEDARALYIPGNQRYLASDTEIEGDWSHAAFYAVLGAMGGDTALAGLNPNSTQGDRAIEAIVSSMGARVFWENGILHFRGGTLLGAVIDVSQTPDLVPALCAIACAAKGTTRIVNASRLRAKESDRLSALASEFSAIGALIEETADSLTITGNGALEGGKCFSNNDHRIAMALACAAPICKKPIILSGYDCVKKSAPDFWQEYISLGGEIHELDMGQAF